MCLDCNDIPDLVVVVGGAVIHLGGSASGSVPISKVEAFVHVGPGDALIAGHGEDLVGVASEAGVDLHLDAVGGAAVGNIEALVAEDLNATASGTSTAGYIPRLRNRVIAGLDDDSRIVGVADSSQTFACLQPGLDGGAAARRRSLNKVDSPFLVQSASAIIDLSRVTIGELAIGVVQTFRCPGQADGSSASRSPLLVRVPGEAGINLHLLAIGGDTVRVIETFIPEDLESAASDRPQLVDGLRMSTCNTGFDFNRCSVGVGGGDEAKGRIRSGVDDGL